LHIFFCSHWLGFNEFISERERTNPKAKDPRMALFDEIVLSKRNRGRTSLFSGRHTTDFMSDTSNHLWRTASATFVPSSRSQQNLSGDYSRIVTRGKSFARLSAFSMANRDCTYSTGKAGYQFDERAAYDSRSASGVEGSQYCPSKAASEAYEWALNLTVIKNRPDGEASMRDTSPGVKSLFSIAYCLL
jgi:hypothetical protein